MIEKQIAEFAANIPADRLELKTNVKGRAYGTSRTINVNVPSVPMPGQPGKVARMQVTFCVNFHDIGTAEEHDAKQRAAIDKTLATADPDILRELLAKYGQ